MLSRLKNKFRRVSRGADSTPDVTQVVASCDNDVTTNLDESHQFTQTVDTAADARMRQRKTGGRHLYGFSPKSVKMGLFKTF